MQRLDTLAQGLDTLESRFADQQRASADLDGQLTATREELRSAEDRLGAVEDRFPKNALIELLEGHVHDWIRFKDDAGAPTFLARERTLCWVSPDSQMYINNDGSTGWTLFDTGGVGAPTGAQYVVLALNADLTAERRLVAGTGLTAVDGGANGDVTLNVDNDHVKYTDAEAIAAAAGGDAYIPLGMDIAGAPITP